jgi:hypothetical protein
MSLRERERRKPMLIIVFGLAGMPRVRRNSDRFTVYSPEATSSE